MTATTARRFVSPAPPHSNSKLLWDRIDYHVAASHVAEDRQNIDLAQHHLSIAARLFAQALLSADEQLAA